MLWLHDLNGIFLQNINTYLHLLKIGILIDTVQDVTLKLQLIWKPTIGPPLSFCLLTDIRHGAGHIQWPTDRLTGKTSTE